MRENAKTITIKENGKGAEKQVALQVRRILKNWKEYIHSDIIIYCNRSCRVYINCWDLQKEKLYNDWIKPYGNNVYLFENRGNDVDDFSEEDYLDNCSEDYSAKDKRTRRFIKRAQNLWGDSFDYTKTVYKNAKTPVCIRCKKCGKEFIDMPEHHLKYGVCLPCIRKEYRELITLYKQKYGNNYDVSLITVNDILENKIPFKCKKCGEIIYIQKDNESELNSHACYIPKKVYNSETDFDKFPKHSKMETKVERWLIENKIPFVFQKKFDWLGRQSLDFYLPENKVAIECQGEQHFRPVDFFGGEKTFKENLMRDKRKKQLCESNDISVLYFSDIKEEIPEKFMRYFDIKQDKKSLIQDIYQKQSQLSY